MELTRSEKTIVLIINILNGLVEKGIFQGGALRINETDELKKEMEGFKPTEEEIKKGMAALQQQGYLSPPPKRLIEDLKKSNKSFNLSLRQLSHKAKSMFNVWRKPG